MNRTPGLLRHFHWLWGNGYKASFHWLTTLVRRVTSDRMIFFVRFFRLCSLLANPISHCEPLYHMRCSHWRLKLQLKLPGDQAFNMFRLAKHFAPCNRIQKIFSWGIQVPLTVPQCGVHRVESRISLRSPTLGESDIACAQKCPHRWSVIQAIVFYPEGPIISLNKPTNAISVQTLV